MHLTLINYKSSKIFTQGLPLYLKKLRKTQNMTIKAKKVWKNLELEKLKKNKYLEF